MTRKAKPPSAAPLLGPLLAKRLERIQERHGLKQAAFAKLAGWSQPWMSRLTSGKGPGWSSIEKIGAGLLRAGADPRELFGLAHDDVTAKLMSDWERANDNTRQIILAFVAFQLEEQAKTPVSAGGIE